MRTKYEYWRWVGGVWVIGSSLEKFTRGAEEWGGNWNGL